MQQLFNEIRGDLFKFRTLTTPIVITTNGSVRRDGECVMGRGTAAQAKYLFPDMPKQLGDRIVKYGNVPFHFKEFNMFTLPVKHYWEQPAEIDLICRSCELLIHLVDRMIDGGNGGISHIYMPRPGCGNGSLEWQDVRLAITPILNRLPHMFTIVEWRSI